MRTKNDLLAYCTMFNLVRGRNPERTIRYLIEKGLLLRWNVKFLGQSKGAEVTFTDENFKENCRRLVLRKRLADNGKTLKEIIEIINSGESVTISSTPVQSFSDWLRNETKGAEELANTAGYAQKDRFEGFANGLKTALVHYEQMFGGFIDEKHSAEGTD